MVPFSFAITTAHITYALASLVALLVMGYGWVKYNLWWQEQWVARCLLTAERDLNWLLSGALQHDGRKSKVAERREWNQLAELPALQINAPGYRSIAHDLVEANEKELSGKSAAIGKAAITAYLLRELYEGDVRAAQMKIFADTRNNDGTPPYIAPGVYELVGFSRFNTQLGFPRYAGVEPRLLRRVVRKGRFPRDIRMTKTDETGAKSIRDQMDTLAQLTQLNL
jgi:hypothetical protein